MLNSSLLNGATVNVVGGHTQWISSVIVKEMHRRLGDALNGGILDLGRYVGNTSSSTVTGTGPGTNLRQQMVRLKVGKMKYRIMVNLPLV